MKKSWVIGFIDGYTFDDLHLYRDEISDDTGVLDYGRVLRFESYDQAKIFMDLNCDSFAHDFFLMELPDYHIDKYEGSE